MANPTKTIGAEFQSLPLDYLGFLSFRPVESACAVPSAFAAFL